MSNTQTVKKTKGRKGLALFPKLALSFLLFALAITVAFAGSLLLAGLYATDGNFMNLMPESILDDEGKLTDLTTVHRLGGWVEKLDENFSVTDVYG